MSFDPLEYTAILMQPERYAPSAWTTHVPFAIFITQLIKPNVFVELGTFSGVSYCAFCQAVDEFNLNTKCYAVDTWRGDEHGGYFGDEILNELTSFHDPKYGEFSELIQDTFDSAATKFSDRSIDLLHIDGYHTYEAVKHDFVTWFPKLNDKGVVLLHDTAVHDKDFGVWKLWDELKETYPNFEFHHGHGLGIIAVGTNYPKSLNLLFKASPDEVKKLQNYFDLIGSRTEYEQKTTMEIAKASSRIAELETWTQNQRRQISTLVELKEKHHDLSNRHIELREKHHDLSNRFASLQEEYNHLTTNYSVLETQYLKIVSNNAYKFFVSIYKTFRKIFLRQYK